MSFIFNDTATTEIYTLSLHDALPILRKTKTGYSTDAKVLQQLAIEHSIADRIIAYRELAKLKGTYIDGLVGLVGEDGRIHSTLNQTTTATEIGRASCRERV